ncbi:SecDF P1 head subdomain-containing protein [Devosia chinhatensis]|uniref:SecDF P1 head subdomain domain-containing protein n=1 Tax=Devosia chinhatensis TaxID=429727 RepID=A0A0F5FGL6_9HYPH|nr:hypothetical protein [Devosia chinhatensis]KKB07715.1 hypothetical protein VE26_13670 [Devosia chinhatensis]
MRTILTSIALFFFLGSSAHAQRLELTVQDASPVYDPQTRTTILEIDLDEVSQIAFADFTSQNVGARIAIYIDDEIILEPKINEPIYGGKIQLAYKSDGAQEVASSLVAGKRIIWVSEIE